MYVCMYVCMYVTVCVRVCVCVHVCVCECYVSYILSLKLCTFCDVVNRVDLRQNMLSGGTSLVKAESLYAYYNAMLIQRINFLDMYVCMYVCMYYYYY